MYNKKGFQKAPFYGYLRDLEQAYDEGTTYGSARGNLPHLYYPRQSLEADVLCLYTEPGTLVHIFQGIVRAITTKVLRKFIATHLHLGPATRTRKQAAVACFYTWVESMT